MDEREAADGVTGLVPLEPADQVPLDADVRQLVLLGERLLHPVLADRRDAGSHRGADRVGTVGLGHRHDGHRMAPSPERLVPVDRLTCLGEPGRKLRERHNLQIYAGMPGNCRAEP